MFLNPDEVQALPDDVREELARIAALPPDPHQSKEAKRADPRGEATRASGPVDPVDFRTVSW